MSISKNTETIVSVWPDHGSGEYQDDGSPYWIVSRDEVEPGSDDAIATDTLATFTSRDEAIDRAKELVGAEPVRIRAWAGGAYETI